ncbi:hypothetical protein N7466_010245 [Penicillium verhagenii]|uniref:uncharacterized protein n=1 Tax=Penicillium verhagenii TaxID=1562060 RepID=UPI0025456D86|nr:uncharacterized protein N7466_010245 [Penicillium verhagenii]KAJ5919302.1 hypothetical protein N7466_010245 [Penicillium verhagenii]
MRHNTAVTRRIHLLPHIGTRKSPRLNIDRARSRESNSTHIVNSDLPSALRNPDTTENANGGRVGCFGKEVREEIVQRAAALPVSAKPEGVVALQSRDPPCGAGGDLFAEVAVLVDVYLARGEIFVHQVLVLTGEPASVGPEMRTSLKSASSLLGIKVHISVEFSRGNCRRRYMYGYIPENLMRPNIQVKPLLLSPSPERRPIRFIPNIPHQPLKRIISLKISHERTQEQIIIRPISIITRPHRRRISMIRAPNIMRQQNKVRAVLATAAVRRIELCAAGSAVIESHVRVPVVGDEVGRVWDSIDEAGGPWGGEEEC